MTSSRQAKGNRFNKDNERSENEEKTHPSLFHNGWRDSDVGDFVWAHENPRYIHRQNQSFLWMSPSKCQSERRCKSKIETENITECGKRCTLEVEPWKRMSRSHFPYKNCYVKFLTSLLPCTVLIYVLYRLPHRDWVQSNQQRRGHFPLLHQYCEPHPDRYRPRNARLNLDSIFLGSLI